MDSPVEPDEQTCELMARIAESRARAWGLVVELLGPPGPDVVARLRSGQWIEEFAAATAWLGEGATRFDRWLASLGAFARRSRRVTAQDDLATLRREHERLAPADAPALAALASELATACHDEAATWRCGGHARAKELRVAQGRRVDEELLEPLTRWTHGADAGAEALVTRMLAGVIASWLAVETGRPIDAGLLPGMAAATEGGF